MLVLGWWRRASLCAFFRHQYHTRRISTCAGSSMSPAIEQMRAVSRLVKRATFRRRREAERAPPGRRRRDSPCAAAALGARRSTRASARLEQGEALRLTSLLMKRSSVAAQPQGREEGSERRRAPPPLAPPRCEATRQG